MTNSIATLPHLDSLSALNSVVKTCCGPFAVLDDMLRPARLMARRLAALERARTARSRRKLAAALWDALKYQRALVYAGLFRSVLTAHLKFLFFWPVGEYSRVSHPAEVEETVEPTVPEPLSPVKRRPNIKINGPGRSN